MSGFIVWDKRYRVFRKLLKIDFELGLYFCIDTVVPFEKGELVKDIGLKDINGKSIYVDSSIVEFKMVINKKEVDTQGYFSYIKEELRYEFYQYFNQRRNFIKAYLSPNDGRIASEFKIIDTIQENKLGLIK